MRSCKGLHSSEYGDSMIQLNTGLLLQEGYVGFENTNLRFRAPQSSGINVQLQKVGETAMRAVIGAFCCGLLLSGPAWAATLELGQGTLSIDQGQGFQPVKKCGINATLAQKPKS